MFEASLSRGQMPHRAMPGAAQNDSTQKDFDVHGGRLPIAQHANGAMELHQQIEQHQDHQKSDFRGEELVQAEIIGSQVVLQFRDLLFRVGPPVVAAPDLFERLLAVDDEDSEDVAGNVEELAPQRVLLLAQALANDHEAPFAPPSQAKLSYRIVFGGFAPSFHARRAIAAP